MVNSAFPRSEIPGSILVVKPSSLGDVLHTLPVVALIKAHWPSSRLRWLIHADWAPLLEGNPDIDEVVIFPREDFRGLRGWTRVLPWITSLRPSVRSDVVLDFQGLLRSALMARFFRGRTVLGLSDAREGARFFYDTVADVSSKVHAVDRYLTLATALGIDIQRPLEWRLPSGVKPPGFVPEQAFVLLHPFSRGVGKSLSAADVQTLCEALAPTRIVLVGRTEMRIPRADNVIDLINSTSLAELIWLIRHAAFVVSVDSGPMHIAAALTDRLIAIHTWTDPRRVGPYQPKAWVWQQGVLCRVADLDRPAQGLPVSDVQGLAAFVRTQIS